MSTLRPRQPRKENVIKNFFAIFAPALAVVAVGVTAAMHGEANDALGLAGLGIILITGALAVAVKTAQHSSRRLADADDFDEAA